MNIRINKLLSDVGLGSRREVEKLVIDGRVTINRRRAILSDVVEESDIVELDGEELPVEEILREYLAEQKTRIAEQLAGMHFNNDFFDEESDYSGGKVQPFGSAKGKSGVKNKSSFRGGKPARFRKFDDEEDFRREKQAHSQKGRGSRKAVPEPRFSGDDSDEDYNFPSFPVERKFRPSSERSSHSFDHASRRQHSGGGKSSDSYRGKSSKKGFVHPKRGGDSFGKKGH